MNWAWSVAISKERVSFLRNHPSNTVGRPGKKTDILCPLPKLVSDATEVSSLSLFAASEVLMFCFIFLGLDLGFFSPLGTQATLSLPPPSVFSRVLWRISTISLDYISASRSSSRIVSRGSHLCLAFLLFAPARSPKLKFCLFVRIPDQTICLFLRLSTSGTYKIQTRYKEAGTL